MYHGYWPWSLFFSGPLTEEYARRGGSMGSARRVEGEGRLVGGFYCGVLHVLYHLSGAQERPVAEWSCRSSSPTPPPSPDRLCPRLIAKEAVINYGEGGLQNGKGGASEVLPLQKEGGGG